MRLLAAALFLTVSLPAAAADITAASVIDAVTVYARGAQIERTIKQKLPAGANAIVLSDLPAEAILGSIRVEGNADGDLVIGSVDAKRVSLLSDDAKAQTEQRKALEDELEKIADGMDQLRADIETKDAQKKLVSNLISLPQQPRPPSGEDADTMPIEEWSKLLALVGTSLADIHREIHETRIAMRDLERKSDDIRKQLAELAPKQEQRTEVRISVQSSGEVNAELIVKYQVRSASWRPQYDARLDTGAEDKPASLTLTRRASIQQSTGEAWTDVTLSLSTSRPSGRSAAPDMQPLVVDFRAPPPPPRPTDGYADGRRRDSTGGQLSMAPRQEPEADEAIAKRAQPQAAKPVTIAGSQLEQSAFQAGFTVLGRVTVPNTGEAKRVKLEDQTLKPNLSARAVPRHDTRAYLYTSLKMPESAPYLAGPVSLFRDGGFVGNGHLPNLAPGADHELGFGADSSVTVKYNVLAEKRGESGIISSSATDERNYRIDITNQHARKIEVTIIDQVPVSLNDDITVDLTGSSNPTKRNFEDKRGVLAWQFPLDPGAKRSIAFGYTVAWPAAKRVDYGYRR